MGIFVGAKKYMGKHKKLDRYCKSVGLNFTTPKEAKEGKYIDRKCPFTSSVNIRGRILKGMVISCKMQRTVVLRRNYLHYIKKYKRFEKRHSNLVAPCAPCFEPKEATSSRPDSAGRSPRPCGSTCSSARRTRSSGSRASSSACSRHARGARGSRANHAR